MGMRRLMRDEIGNEVWLIGLLWPSGCPRYAHAYRQSCDVVAQTQAGDQHRPHSTNPIRWKPSTGKVG